MPFLETCPVDEKVRFCTTFEQGDQTMTELCRQFGISRKTGYEVLASWQAGGAAALLPKSHAPLSCPHRLEEAMQERVLGLRHVHPKWGPRKIKARLELQEPGHAFPAASTIGDLLTRNGLTVPRRKRQRVTPSTRPFATCGAPNDLWSMDFKGWFRTADGQRCDPFTLQDQASRYLLRLIAVKATDGAHVFPILDAAFREFGLPLAIRSDNGPPFGSTGCGGLSWLGVQLIKAGVLPDHTDPASPQQNGRLERMHRTLKDETASPPANSIRAQSRRFDGFQRIYNDERPHEGIGQAVPASVYTASSRSWNGRLTSPDYADDVTVRRVRKNGEIRWRCGLVYVNSALTGEPVGLTETEEGGWTVHYGPILLGTVNAKGKLVRPRASAIPGRRSRDAFRSNSAPVNPQSVTHHAG